MNENSNRAEAERLLGVAEKLLQSRDFNGTRDFAILAQETEPSIEGSDQILAVADVLLAAEKPLSTSTPATATTRTPTPTTNHHDWYSILQVPARSDDNELIKKQYRKLALLLHPDKNKSPFSDQAFKLVADAWAVLSDPEKKSRFDNQLGFFSKVDLTNSTTWSKLPLRRSERPGLRRETGSNSSQQQPIIGNNRNTNYSNTYEGGQSSSGGGGRSQRSTRMSAFWTLCPYCYLIYEYPRVYENCCLRCQHCRRAFHAALIPNLPPLVPGKEAYYCSWGFFPLGFVFGGGDGQSGGGEDDGAAAGAGVGFPSWMPPMFGAGQRQAAGGDKSGGGAAAGAGRGALPVRVGVGIGGNGVVNVPVGNATLVELPKKRGRGRPRKNPL